jgi:hypothetical protein
MEVSSKDRLSRTTLVEYEAGLRLAALKLNALEDGLQPVLVEYPSKETFVTFVPLESDS